MDRFDRYRGCLLGGAAGDALGYRWNLPPDRDPVGLWPPGNTDYALMMVWLRFRMIPR